MNRDHVKIAWKFDRKTARRKFDYKPKPFKRSRDLVMMAHAFLTLETLRGKKNLWVDPAEDAS